MRVSIWSSFWVFCTRFSKSRLKFLRQMPYGIQITKSVILNMIAAEADGIQKLLTRYGKG